MGRKRARGTPPTWWLARPILCRAVDIEPGEPTCTTRSTEPMSIPISRLDEDTTARNRPFFRRFSTSSRMDLSMEPW